MIAWVIRRLFYDSTVGGVRDALADMGFISPDAPGTPPEQVRAVVAEQPAAVEDKPAKKSKQ